MSGVAVTATARASASMPAGNSDDLSAFFHEAGIPITGSWMVTYLSSLN